MPARVGVTTPKSPSTTAPTLTGGRGWDSERPAPAARVTLPTAAVLRKPRLVVVMNVSCVALPASSPAAQARVEMLEEQHDGDRHHRHDGGGREELGRPEGQRRALHLEAHPAVACEHLGDQGA